MIEVYVGFSALCWCYISCGMTDDTSLQENVCWDKLTYQLLLNFALAAWVDAQPALQVWRLQGFPQAIAPLKFGLLCNQTTILVPVSAENCGFLAPMQTPCICLHWSKATLSTLSFVLQGIKVVNVASWPLTGTDWCLKFTNTIAGMVDGAARTNGVTFL